MRFMLGTHMANWLWDDDARLDGVTLFISRNRLAKRVSAFPAARRDWALDSGGFTELKDHGGWRTSPEEYAAEVRRYRDQLGRLLWAAPQDWMCEPWVIFGGTYNGATFVGTKDVRGINPGEPDDLEAAVRMHQEFTVQNYVELRRIAPDLPWIPVLQGWSLAAYQRCADMYADAGIDLTAAPVVGLGSVCRRQATEEIARIVNILRRALADRGSMERLYAEEFPTGRVAECRPVRQPTSPAQAAANRAALVAALREDRVAACSDLDCHAAERQTGAAA